MESPASSVSLYREAPLDMQKGLVPGPSSLTPFRTIAWLSVAATTLSLLIAAALSLIVLGVSH
ncbi:MAG TPA: hypothetical protein VG273_14685 [Bryobacteraceae bacterium]|jgi:hypothetical protein|nr:hypothetical protein [Bryobacteraceae bacterium]